MLRYYKFLPLLLIVLVRTFTLTPSIAQANNEKSIEKSIPANQLAFGETQVSNAYIARHGLSGADYQREFEKHTQNGYRLTHISGYGVNGKDFYAAIWEKRGGPAYIARHGLSNEDYQRESEKHTQNGYRLTHVSGYGINGKDFYAAIWEKRGGSAYIARHGLSSADYQREFEKHTQNGYRLTHVSGYGINGKDFYAAIWEKRGGSAYIARHGLSSADYQREFDKHTQNGYRPTHVSGYQVNGQDFYAAIWEKRGGSAYIARHNMTSKGYQCQFDNQHYQGYRLKHISGYAQGGKARYAAIWESTGAWDSADIEHIDSTIKTFMNDNQVSGASLAITKDGRLVFAKGYGYADKSKGERVCANTQFLSASMAKTLTSAAIMKLVEQGQLRLSDKVFGTGGLLGNTYGSKTYSSAEQAITVEHLLEHTAGGNEWDNNKRPPEQDTIGDPMFTNPSYNHNQLIGWVLDERKIDTLPGTSYNYSNFGYSILGRIIEKITGLPYESFVRQEILKPAAIQGMHIAGEKRPNEVAHDDFEPSLLARMDSHGGWIGSSIDWTRFLVRIDGFESKPDILQPSTLETMTTSSLGRSYAKGLRVNSSNNWWHGGKLGKSRSVMVRTNSGYTWAFHVHGMEGGDSLDSTMWDVINGIQNWPAHDLF